jgi:hypothetical protein
VSARRAQLGGVSAGGSSGATIVHVDLPASMPAHAAVHAHERHAQKIERAMALADGVCARLPDGTVAWAAHRLVRDGARVALITIPDLLRFDVHPRADCFSFNVRNLNGLPVRDNAHELPVRPYHRPDGPPLNEYELQLKTPEGYAVCIVVRVPPYFGALEHEYSAVALLS